MSRIKLIGALLSALLLGGLGYVYSGLHIFLPPQNRFIAPAAAGFEQVSPLCHKNRQNPTALSQESFRFLVWNLHKGADSGWRELLARLSEKQDFMLLQEVSSGQALERHYADRFPAALYTRTFAYQGEASGLALLAENSPDLYCAGAEKEPWIMIPKAGNAMRFPLAANQSLLVVNLHLINFEWQPTAYRRQLENMMALVARHQGPIIMGGDFNSWNRERTEILRQLAQRYELQEVAFSPDERLRFFGHALDHVFVRGLKILQATTLRTDSSDHNPLLVEAALITTPP
ncbi:endonuclease/exonuclease/phosphatase (EEP) superfamily protein YafD [Mesocricetibacter intestinalis]|uniref:Endonuclease/exonuclease/phosphatase (EEP) superfamily protein YafD n=1 Tax=Mesocricetibacter intestinalis TaxID=1521930 RepID=A0A4R6VFQ1_9PAST|nr:endonuclease/exonuclease/phosphatase family protein [Mesocricetibacter intestinalis]TDQ59825.1 endonuclease/exonuclease/phosphatase (EEP) superfamily protein YafD [Mesocricetibacter intestinalis]